MNLTYVSPKRPLFYVSHKKESHNLLLKEDAFSTLNSESSYWIGFILADGNIYRRRESHKPVLQINLSAVDEEHLWKFRDFLSAAMIPKICKNSVIMQVYSHQIVEDLSVYGIVPGKSGKESVPEILKNDRDFWRGYIDGDGCITVKRKIYPRLILMGTRNICEGFKKFVCEEGGTCKASVRLFIGKVYYLEIQGNLALKTMDILYKDCVTCLDRKYDRYLEFKQWQA